MHVKKKRFTERELEAEHVKLKKPGVVRRVQPMARWHRRRSEDEIEYSKDHQQPDDEDNHNNPEQHLQHVSTRFDWLLAHLQFAGLTSLIHAFQDFCKRARAWLDLVTPPLCASTALFH